MLLKLFDIILVPILSEWIEINDVCALDTAFCNSVSRDTFLGIFELNQFAHNTKKLITSINYFKWLGIRKLKVKDISLAQIENLVDLKQFGGPVLQEVKYIRHLTIHNGPEFCFLMVNYCCNIESLSLLVRKHDNQIDGLELMKDIKSLKSLDISSFNDLPDSVVENLLEYFAEIENVSVSVLPSKIKISTLKKVDVYYMETGHISEIAVNSPLLEHLHFDDYIAVVSGDELLVLAEKCPKLTSLRIKCSYVSDVSICKIVENCAYLTHLNCGYAGITDKSLFTIAKYSKALRYINVSSFDSDASHITDKGVITILHSCLLLDSINISGNEKLTDTTLNVISKCSKHLTYLNVGCCHNFTEGGVISIIEKCQLKRLVITECKSISSNALVLCANDSDILTMGIQNLDEYWDSVSKHVVKSGQTRYNRTILDLTHLSLTVFSFVLLSRFNVNLLRLQLNGIKNIDGIAMELIIIGCKLLERIQISNCSKLTTNLFIYITDKLINFHTLIFDYADEGQFVFDHRFVLLLTQFPNMQRIDLVRVGTVSNDIILHIAQRCIHLKQFSISDNELLTTECLVHLITNCKSLHTLYAEKCKLFDATLLHAIEQHTTKLRKLNVDRCDNISCAEKEEFYKRNRSISRIYQWQLEKLI